ncbi:MAG: amidohydrolase family protein, partial [Bifidobacteriaceae bacterium]|nr:amidohydrolase family protein [Bifidobacteriaceae bacterium]
GLSQTGGHGDGRDLMVDDPSHACRTSVIVDSPDQVRRVVRELFRRGACAIKMMTSGGVISEADPLRAPQFTAAEIQAATEEANRRGSYVTVHAYSPEAIRHSIDNGVRCIEHGNLLDAETARAMAQAHIPLDPTLITYDAMDRRGDDVGLTKIGRAKNSEVLAQGKDAVRIARDAGVLIGFGTDLMGDLEDEQLGGLRLMTEVLGLDGALEAATVSNAKILRLPDVGAVRPGAAADLVLLGGDLAAAPELLWDEAVPRTVIQAGRVL